MVGSRDSSHSSELLCTPPACVIVRLVTLVKFWVVTVLDWYDTCQRVHVQFLWRWFFKLAIKLRVPLTGRVFACLFTRIA